MKEERRKVDLLKLSMNIAKKVTDEENLNNAQFEYGCRLGAQRAVFELLNKLQGYIHPAILKEIEDQYEN